MPKGAGRKPKSRFSFKGIKVNTISVNYSLKMLDVVDFPEIWTLRTSLWLT